MIADSLRRVLLKAGRASTRGWVRRLEAGDPDFYCDTRRTYGELTDQVAWPTKPALQMRTLNAAAIAPAYCAVDDVLYSGVGPQLRWARSGTLATGATHCDFCFMNTSMPDSQRRPSRAPPKPDRRP